MKKQTNMKEKTNKYEEFNWSEGNLFVPFLKIYQDFFLVLIGVEFFS
jgi:hypothetical protein